MVINVRGRFDLQHREFREIKRIGVLKRKLLSLCRCTVHGQFGAWHAVDAARECGWRKRRSYSSNDGEIQKILAIANFQKLFTINQIRYASAPAGCKRISAKSGSRKGLRPWNELESGDVSPR